MSLHSRRSLLRASATGALLALAGWSTPTSTDADAVPVFVDNRDDDAHDMRVWVDGDARAEQFSTRLTVDAGALVHATDVTAAVCLHADVLTLDGELSDCLSASDTDHSPHGVAVVIYSSAREHGERWRIVPVPTPRPPRTTPDYGAGGPSGPHASMSP